MVALRSSSKSSLTLPMNGTLMHPAPLAPRLVNRCVERSDHAGTDSAWARSRLSWGSSTTSPTKGPTTLVVGCDRGPRATRYIFAVQVTGRDATPVEQEPRRDPTITLEDLPVGAEVKLTVHTQNAAGDSPVSAPLVVKLV